jgi:hypothetical protein
MPVAELYRQSAGEELVTKPCSFWRRTIKTLGLIPQLIEVLAIMAAALSDACPRYPLQYESELMFVVLCE